MIWTHYFLQVNLYLILFYCFYRIMLSKETYFNFNRVFLVGSAILSLVIPFLRVEWLTRHEATQQIYTGVKQINSYMESFVITPVEVQAPLWPKYIALIYVLGICILLIRFLLHLVLLNVTIQQQIKGTAFSFFNVKKVDKDLPESDIIDAHEDLHVKQFHSFDIIFFEILTIFLWFNPIVYLYKYAVKNIHEYLADREAVRLKGDTDAYSILLLSNTFNVHPQVFTNNFYNKSMVKKRIAMLYKSRSKKVAIYKYGLIVPLFGFAVILSSSTIRESEQLKNVATTIPLGVQALIDEVKRPEKPTKKIHLEQSGMLIFRNYIAANLKDLQLKNTTYSILSFEVKDGKVLFNKVASDYSIADKNKTDELLRTFNFSKVKDGHYVLPIIWEGLHSDIRPPMPMIAGNNTKFISALYLNPTNNDADLSIDNNTSNTQNNPSPQSVSDDAVKADISLDPSLLELAKQRLDKKAISSNNNAVVFSETMPEYTGGNQKLRQFLTKNIVYPISAINAHKTGTVYVNFTVEKDGSIDNIHVNNRLGYGLDEEAMRVVAMTNLWRPASQNGKAVRVKHQIPVAFILN